MKYIHGDLLDVKHGIICHGCNLSGGFGSGVAFAIARRYPSAREHYRSNYKSSSLGDAKGLKVSNDLYVLNCFTQQFYGRNSNIVYADVNAIHVSIKRAAKLALNLGYDCIHMPRIGAGLGGLNWDSDVVPVLNNVETLTGIDIVVHSL